MERNQIVLSEQELHMLVEDAVRIYLQENLDEGFLDTVRGGASALGNLVGRAAKQGAGKAMDAAGGVANRVGTAVGNAANRVGTAVGNAANRVGTAVGNAADKVGEVGQNIGRTVKAGAMNANVQAAIRKTNAALDELIKVASPNPAILGNDGSVTLSTITNLRQKLASAGGRSKSNLSAKMNQTMGSMGLA